MKDSVILGTGNSRYLKSVENFKTLYPTYDDFVAALVAGTLPVDFNGINTAGFQQVGDGIGKNTLLKDATASLFGLDVNALPDDVFRVLSTQGWALLAEFRSAGSFSWTPPDELFEEGETTAIIGVYMVGGGGGGGLGVKRNYNVASGGAAGYGANFIFTVTKGVAISLVVGAGGTGSAVKGAHHQLHGSGKQGGPHGF